MLYAYVQRFDVTRILKTFGNSEVLPLNYQNHLNYLSWVIGSHGCFIMFL